MSNEQASDGDALVLEGRDLCFIPRLSHSVAAETPGAAAPDTHVAPSRLMFGVRWDTCSCARMELLLLNSCSTNDSLLSQSSVISEAQNAAFVGGEKILFTA